MCYGLLIGKLQKLVGNIPRGKLFHGFFLFCGERALAEAEQAAQLLLRLLRAVQKGEALLKRADGRDVVVIQPGGGRFYVAHICLVLFGKICKQ